MQFVHCVPLLNILEQTIEMNVSFKDRTSYESMRCRQ